MNGNGDPIVLNDRYQIDRRIGRGGMADVFVARDLLLDRQVAIKVLFAEFATDPNFVERFRREAQAAANLSHPNIVNVYDWGRYSGTYYIAMEYVQGRTLADILRANGQLTSKQSAEVASEVASALSFAHKAGLVHRDIKPANILIGTNGQVKVADFGIARAMGAAAESKLTQAGAVMGTATYFSPEQAQGGQPHPRSDLYSLGIVMYEMAAGHPPFVGDNPVGIAYKQVHDAPQPLNRLVADIPRGYEAIVAKLLAKDPGRRYQNGDELRDDLRRFRAGEVPEALRAILDFQNATAATATGAAAAQALHTMAMPATAPFAGSAIPPRRIVDDQPSRSGWYALAAFLAMIALAVGGYLLYRVLTEGDEEGSRRLDNYVGQPLNDVLDELDRLGIMYAEPIEEPNSTQRPGHVDRTDPEPREIVVDSQPVRLYYAPMPDRVRVPEIRGLTVEAARGILRDRGLEIGEQTEEASDDVEVGLVMRTAPRPNRAVAEGTAVDIVVSSGPGSVAIPADVVGIEEAAARARLEGDPFNFIVTSQTVVSGDVALGLVVGTDPEAGTLTEAGSAVTLLVSGGPGQVAVPTLTGLSEQDARSALADARLSLGDVSIQELSPGDANDGRVVAQSVASGTPVDPDTPISITVGQAAEPTAPPATAPPETTPAETDPPATVPPATVPPATEPPTTTTEPPTTTTEPPTTTTESPATTTSPPNTTTATAPPPSVPGDASPGGAAPGASTPGDSSPGQGDPGADPGAGG
ncbi:Stk1 family PASTA domain-containing Ser/Thr kinase [soil metagenome]